MRTEDNHEANMRMLPPSQLDLLTHPAGGVWAVVDEFATTLHVSWPFDPDLDDVINMHITFSRRGFGRALRDFERADEATVHGPGGGLVMALNRLGLVILDLEAARAYGKTRFVVDLPIRRDEFLSILRPARLADGSDRGGDPILSSSGGDALAAIP